MKEREMKKREMVMLRDNQIKNKERTFQIEKELFK